MGEVVNFPPVCGAYWRGYRAEVEPRLLAQGYPVDVVQRVLLRLEKFCFRFVDEEGWAFELDLSPHVLPGQSAPVVEAVTDEVRKFMFSLVGDAMAAAILTFLELEAS